MPRHSSIKSALHTAHGSPGLYLCRLNAHDDRTVTKLRAQDFQKTTGEIFRRTAAFRSDK